MENEKQKLNNYFDALHKAFDNLYVKIDKCENWEELGDVLSSVTIYVVESDDDELRKFYGTILTVVFKALAEGGTSDALIIAGRMRDTYETITKPILRDIQIRMIRDIEDGKKEDSTGSNN